MSKKYLAITRNSQFKKEILRTRSTCGHDQSRQTYAFGHDVNNTDHVHIDLCINIWCCVHYLLVQKRSVWIDSWLFKFESSKIWGRRRGSSDFPRSFFIFLLGCQQIEQHDSDQTQKALAKFRELCKYGRDGSTSESYGLHLTTASAQALLSRAF